MSLDCLDLLRGGLPESKVGPRHVVIVGAGMAGLTAGLLLKNAGHKVTILEGQNRLGGRILTYRGFAGDMYGEFGAMRFPLQHSLVQHLIQEKFKLETKPFPMYDEDTLIYLQGKAVRRSEFSADLFDFDLLPDEDRRRVLGIIVNRFRGEAALFEDGVSMLEAMTGFPVLAVVPYLDHGLDEEDRPLRIPLNTRAPAGMLRVGALLSPAVANTEDLAPLLAEPDVHLTWITDPRLVSEQDLLVLPASKATVADLVRHTASGMALAVSEAYAAGCWILGLCGGYQMLGEHLEDAGGTEGGPKTWPGLGLLPIDTIFESEKRTRQQHCVSAWPLSGRPLAGYEIHHGQTHSTGRSEPLLVDAGAELGCRRDRAVGSYLHGLLADDEWRAAFLNTSKMIQANEIAEPVSK